MGSDFVVMPTPGLDDDDCRGTRSTSSRSRSIRAVRSQWVPGVDGRIRSSASSRSRKERLRSSRASSTAASACVVRGPSLTRCSVPEPHAARQARASSLPSPSPCIERFRGPPWARPPLAVSVAHGSARPIAVRRIRSRRARCVDRLVAATPSPSHPRVVDHAQCRGRSAMSAIAQGGAFFFFFRSSLRGCGLMHRDGSRCLWRSPPRRLQCGGRRAARWR
jgi:hypothetical protein